MYDPSQTQYARPQHAPDYAPPDASSGVAPDSTLAERLNWLETELAREEKHRRRFRSAEEERQMLLMRRPVPVYGAFAFFGALTGLFPPAAIFALLFGYGLTPRFNLGLFMMCLWMTAVCCLVGYAMGGYVGKRMETIERRSWSLTMLAAIFYGALWGLVTGGTGGCVFIGFGAIFGAIFAIPIGTLAFTLFIPLHRLLMRGGIIDRRHLLPLACGITAAIVVGILRVAGSQ